MISASVSASISASFGENRKYIILTLWSPSKTKIYFLLFSGIHKNVGGKCGRLSKLSEICSLCPSLLHYMGLHKTHVRWELSMRWVVPRASVLQYCSTHCSPVCLGKLLWVKGERESSHPPARFPHAHPHYSCWHKADHVEDIFIVH